MDPTAPTPATPPPALATVLYQHGDALRRVASAYARTPDQRADLYQEIALALCRALPQFRGDCGLRSFVLRVAHNVALAAALRRRAHDAPLDTDDVLDALPAPLPDPEGALDDARRRARFEAALLALPLPHRQVLTLGLEGLSHEEIADVLGTNANAVGVRIHRARNAMRALLGDPR